MSSRIADELVNGMRKSVRPGLLKLRNFVQGRAAARQLISEVKGVEALISSGKHPLHATYINAQNYLSVFAELASKLKEFSAFLRVVGDAEETYAPGWPPVSPVSVSFFTSWAFLDFPVAATDATICSCAAEIGRAFAASDDFVSTLQAMGDSAMGIYEYLGWQDGLLGLRDILDQQEYRCIVPSGHHGCKGELWYVRLLPPLNEAFVHSVAFTSPYVLRGASPGPLRPKGGGGCP
jgi:hypothetical protein